MLYFDQAATSYHRPKRVARAVYEAIVTMGNASRSVHEAALTSSRVIYETRERLAGLFSVGEPDSVAFTSGATESLNLVIQGLISSGDHVITTAWEHNSVLRPLELKKRAGAKITVIKADGKGNLSYGELEAAIGKDTKAIIATHASNVTGNLLDIHRIGEICKRKGILFVLDAAQTAGVFPIDMKKEGIDVLCFTGHKGLLGPQGTGGICLSKGLILPPVKVGGSGFLSESLLHPTHMPAALEAGTLNGHGIAGLCEALAYIEEYGMDKIRVKEQKWMRQFYNGIKEIPSVQVYGDFTEENRAPIVSFNIGEHDSGAVSACLWEDYGIACRSGMHCAYPMHEALGTKKQGTVRFSFSHLNTKDEITAAIEAVRRLAEEESI